MRITTIILLLAFNILYSQKNQLPIRLYMESGIGNLIEKNWELYILIGNSYDTYKPYFGLKVTSDFPIMNDKLYAEYGLGMRYFQTFMGLKDYIPLNSMVKKNDHFTIQVPLKLNYKYEEFIFIAAGFENRFMVNSPPFSLQYKNRGYVLGFSGGVDLILKKKYIVGLDYYRDLTPTFQYNTDINIDYISQQFGLKLGYILK